MTKHEVLKRLANGERLRMGYFNSSKAIFIDDETGNSIASHKTIQSLLSLRKIEFDISEGNDNGFLILTKR